ncbi:MAG: chromate transporter [Cytophagaceae bacterium]|nr:chromate transporter [Gemmatimonadaceae bacterium]
MSLLAIGGAIATTSEMHRYLVEQRAWLTDQQFTSSIALAQAAPGPNILFVALFGWQVGLNAAGPATDRLIPWSALLGMAVSMIGILGPSSVLTYVASQWAHRHRTSRGVRAFKAGMAPVVVALLLSTAWVLASARVDPARDWRAWALTAVSALVVWRTRLHLLWLLGFGALLGGLGVL